MTESIRDDKQAWHERSERHQTKGDLQAEYDFITTVLNTVDTLIVVLDPNGRIIRFNHACETLTGRTFDEVQGQLFWDLLPLSTEKAAAQEHIAQLLTSRFPIKSKNHWVAKNGCRRLIAWTNTTLYDAQGSVSYIISSGFDTTEREHTARLLNASESLQRVTTNLLQHLTTLEDVLSIACSEACHLTGAKGSAILLLENETRLQVKSRCGSPLPILLRLPLDDSFAETVIKQRIPLLLNDPQSQMPAYRRSPAVKALLAVPLCVDGTVLGVLDVINKPGGFTKADLNLIHSFADHAAISIEHAQLHQQAEKLAVIEERQRLARELHDSVTQALYSVSLYADAARLALSSGKQDVAAAHLRELRSMAREAMLDMRLLIFELHPPVLEKEGLAIAVQTRLETVETRFGLQFTFHVEGENGRLPLVIEEDLYRIAQEALNNIVKHAKAQQVTVWLRFSKHHFCLEVRDDGIGFDPDRVGKSGGLGLRGIKERVQRIGGQFILESALDKGTVLKVEVDL
jgi:PAS domain S-box-containing protein